MRVPKIRFWSEGLLSTSRLRALYNLRSGALGNRHDSARWLRAIAPTLAVASDVLEQSDGQARGLALRVLSQVLTIDQAMTLVYDVNYARMVSKSSDFHDVAITRENLREAHDAFRRDMQNEIRAAIQIPFTAGDIVGVYANGDYMRQQSPVQLQIDVEIDTRSYVSYTGLHADRFYVDDPNDLGSAREHARALKPAQRPQPQAHRVNRVV